MRDETIAELATAGASTGLSRRAAIAVSGGVAAGCALLLSGCSSANGSTNPVSGKPSVDASAQPAGTSIVKLAEVPVGGSVAANLNGKPVLISQPEAGKVVAFSALCTHQQCVVAAAGTSLDCPCHGSSFDAVTGAVITGPALKPLPPIAVKIEGADVVSA